MPDTRIERMEDLAERLRAQFEFILTIDREKQVLRQTRLADGSRQENDAEHAWHMAVMTLLLAEYANEKIDVARTVAMLLVHDLVEVYAGDTFAYDEKAKETQRERELAAADRLYRLLPEDQAVYMRGLWDEFEAEVTPEAKFARTMDNLQPMMLNAATDGANWEAHGVRLSQILRRNANTSEGSEILWQYAKQQYLDPNVAKGRIIDDITEKENQQD